MYVVFEQCVNRVICVLFTAFQPLYSPYASSSEIESGQSLTGLDGVLREKSDSSSSASLSLPRKLADSLQ